LIAGGFIACLVVAPMDVLLPAVSATGVMLDLKTTKIRWITSS